MADEPIPADQRAGYCCPMPTLQFTWHLGTAENDLTVRVLQITGLSCMNCGADYVFDTEDETFPLLERDRAVLRVHTKNLRVQ